MTSFFIGGVDGWVQNGVVYMNAEQIAFYLGLCDKSKGKPYPKWAEMRKYLCQAGRYVPFSKNTFISEEDFVALAGRLKNKTAKQNIPYILNEVIPEAKRKAKESEKRNEKQN